MRKIAVLVFALALSSCGSGAKPTADRPLYEVLVSKPDGGGNIRFFEIVSTPEEFQMLQGDENLKKKITSADINTANFIILNMGEKNTGGHSITVDKVVETPEKILVTVKEESPGEGGMATQAITYPYAIVRVNSKKPIEIK